MKPRLLVAIVAAISIVRPGVACSDDAGAIRADAKVLLAHTARALALEPNALTIATVSVSGDTAGVSWESRAGQGKLALERRDGRWFVTCPPATDVVHAHWPLLPQGGAVQPGISQTSCYAMTVRYAPNDAQPNSRFSFVYGRTPTSAEFLPYPTTYPFTSNAVYFFDITIDGPKPVTFAPGTQIEVWFPFVLDDRLRYDISIAFAQAPIDTIHARPFDNTLQFVLPALTALPGKMLMGEIDGDTQ